jgi:hypothetical protein
MMNRTGVKASQERIILMERQNTVAQEHTRDEAEKDTPPDQLDFAIEELESRISFVLASTALNVSLSFKNPCGSSSSSSCGDGGGGRCGI